MYRGLSQRSALLVSQGLPFGMILLSNWDSLRILINLKLNIKLIFLQRVNHSLLNLLDFYRSFLRISPSRNWPWASRTTLLLPGQSRFLTRWLGLGPWLKYHLIDCEKGLISSQSAFCWRKQFLRYGAFCICILFLSYGEMDYCLNFMNFSFFNINN